MNQENISGASPSLSRLVQELNRLPGIGPKSAQRLAYYIIRLPDDEAYALADVVVVGRSFGDLHGSDMMEPAALGKPVVVGPATGDFRETVDRLSAGGGLVVTDRAGLPAALGELLETPARRTAVAEAARAVIREQQGATERTARLLRSMLDDARRHDA